MLNLLNNGVCVHKDMLLERNLYVASLIERYLLSHPNAMDNLDGIIGWWLTQQKINESVHAVSCALELLVDKGVVEKVRDGYYRCTMN